MDPCLSEIMGNTMFESCNFLKTSEQVLPIKTGQLLYRSKVIDGKLTVSRNMTWKAESRFSRIFSVEFRLDNLARVPETLFKPYDFKTPMEVIQLRKDFEETVYAVENMRK